MMTGAAYVAMAALLTLAMFSSTAVSEEAVFCMSEENRYVVHVEGGEECLPEEATLKFSGGGVDLTGGPIPLAEFSPNADCPEGTSGTRAEVGLDYNSNGKLEPGEVVSVTSNCGTGGGREKE